jgi:hypothetical protein
MVTYASRQEATLLFPILGPMMMTTDIARISGAICDQGREEPEEGTRHNNPQKRSKKGPPKCHKSSKDAAR